MKKLFLTFCVFGILFCATSCSDDNDPSMVDMDPMEQNDDPLEALVLTDVSYGDNEQQVYDLYLPAGRTSNKTKVLVLVHGGGWIEGDKADMTAFIGLIQSNLPNHAIVNMNYVLATATIPAFPNQFLDVDAVINKITEEKELLQVNPEFGLIGTSAGGHISLMYDYVYDTDDQVKMVADIVGPTNFTDPFYSENPNFNILLSLLVDESQYPNDAILAEVTSPTFQVSTNSSPTIMFYGNADPLVPLANGQQLAQLLTGVSVSNSFTVYEGGHGDDWSASDRLDLEVQLRTFITNYLPVPIQ